ncbi:MAG: aminotransferase class V-fold PLP-dependent enzyme [Frankiales bacterium]|nr:aminotransferase class V-fold PLP-dependent enzyme [Frankiales bacterium]
MSGYFDAATTAPLHPAARAALEVAVADGWADPRRAYREGRQARRLLDAARASVASSLGARPDEVTFTSSGTAAVQLGLLGALASSRRRGRHLVASAVEHSAVLATAQLHERDGGSVELIGVDGLGRVDAEAFAAALRPDTALACLQTANHEVGTTQPLGRVSEACAAAGVPLFGDAAASIGRLAPPPAWDVLVASARKWAGPAGVGVLAVRTGTRWRSVLPDDEGEGGRFPGGVPVPLAVAAAAALEAVEAERAAESARLSALVDRLRAELPARVPDVELLGDPSPAGRLPHVLAFSCLYVAGEALMTELDRAGFSVSSGSSCSSSALTPSHVLVAMGALTHGNVRLGLHAGITDEDVTAFLDALPPIVASLRSRAGAEGL